MSTHNKGFYKEKSKLSLNYHQICTLGLIFFILGLRIFFQNIKVGGGKKIKIKITKKIFFI